MTDFNVYRGANISATITVRDPAGLPMNLTGWQWETLESGIEDFTVEITNPTQGVSLFKVAKDVTKDLAPVGYLFRLRIVSPNGIDAIALPAFRLNVT